MKNLITLLLSLMWVGSLNAQEDLLQELEGLEEPQTNYAYATFKSIRIVNGHSIEMPAANELQVVISHRFGRINEGASELFGLDQANIRLGLEYGLTDWLEVGVGRSNVRKTYDGFLKLRLLRQSEGERNFPVTVSYVSGIMVNTLPWRDETRDNLFSSRLSFNHQVLIARKFSESFSLQVTPTLIHRNLVETIEEPNDVLALGVGFRQKLNSSLSINVEYFHLLTEYTADNFEPSLSIGLDIETGGHVFQLFFSNAQAMTENLFVAETTGSWGQGDIHFGFNVNRVFNLKKNR
ncbi:MAG: DUF5777 family beta-barrel protein [Bacteroidota bacterium]